MSTPDTPITWSAVVEPITQKLAIHAVTQQPAKLTPEACQVMARLMHQMAAKMDAHGIPIGDV